MTVIKLPSPREQHASGRLVTVGQLSIDTIVALGRPLVVGDQNTGAMSSSIGGTAAIVAHNAAILGGAPTFAGHIGSSPADQDALTQLMRAGVAVAATVSTLVGLRVCTIVGPDGERTMIAAGPNPEWSRLQMLFSPADIAFFEGWHLFDPDGQVAYCKLITAAAAAGATVALDVCSASRATGRHQDLLAALPLDILLANRDEAEAFRLLHAPTARMVVVHQGPDPTLTLVDGDLQRHNVRPVLPADTTGAGDTFAAGFLLSLSRGAELSTAVRHGHEAALSVVQIIGPLLPSAPANQTLAV